MWAYIVDSNARFEPFEECARDCWIGNMSLAQTQRDILRNLGIGAVSVKNRSVIRDHCEHLVLSDNLYFSPELLSEFIAKARQNKMVCICALKKGVTTTRTAANLQKVTISNDRVEYDMVYYPADAALGQPIIAVVINPDELQVSLPMPSHMCDPEVFGYSIPVTDKFIIQIDNWVSLWMANIVTVLAFGARLQKSTKMKLFQLAWKAKSFSKWKISRASNQIGDFCDIHPTAYVEGSVIGHGVTLGAGAIVRNSLIGNDSYIGNGVIVEQSVVGNRCTILNGRVLFSVMCDCCFSVADMITASYLGQDCFLGLNSTQTDFRLDGKNVMVKQVGAMVDSGNRFLGSCLGHGVYLGSGTIVAPGRTIPHDTRIAVSEDKIVRICSSDQKELQGFRIVSRK